MKKVLTLVSALSMVAGSAFANDYDWSGLENPKTDTQGNVQGAAGLTFANNKFTFSVNAGDKIQLGVNGENLEIKVNGSPLSANLESGKITFNAEADGTVELTLGANTTVSSIYVESDYYRTALDYINNIGKKAVNEATVKIAGYSTEEDAQNQNLSFGEFFSAVKAQINLEAQKVADMEAELKTAKANNTVDQTLLTDFNTRLTAVANAVNQVVTDAAAAKTQYETITRNQASSLDSRLTGAKTAPTNQSQIDNASLTWIYDYKWESGRVQFKSKKADWVDTELKIIEDSRDALKKAAMDELAKFPEQYAEGADWTSKFNALKDQVDNMVARAIVERDYKNNIENLQSKVTKLDDVLKIKNGQETVFTKPAAYDSWTTTVKELNEFINKTNERRSYTQAQLQQNPVNKYNNAETTFNALKTDFTNQAYTELTKRVQAAQDSIDAVSYKIAAKYQNEPETQKDYEKQFAQLQTELSGYKTTVDNKNYATIVEGFNTIAGNIDAVNTKVGNLWTKTLSAQKQEVVDLNAAAQKKIDDQIDAVRAYYNTYIEKIEKWKKADFQNEDMVASLNANQRTLFDIVGELDDTKEEVAKVVAAYEAKINAKDDVEFDPNNNEYRFEGKNAQGVAYADVVAGIETRIKAEIDAAVVTANDRAKDYFYTEKSYGKATLTLRDADDKFYAAKQYVDDGLSESKMTQAAHDKFVNRYQGILDKSQNNNVGENYRVAAVAKANDYYANKTLADNISKVSSDYLEKIEAAVKNVNKELDSYTSLYEQVSEKKVKWTVAKSKETTYQTTYEKYLKDNLGIELAKDDPGKTFVKDTLELINSTLKDFSTILENKALEASTLDEAAAGAFKVFEDGYFKATNYGGYVANDNAKAKAESLIATVKAEIANAKTAIADYREDVKAEAMAVINAAEQTVAAQEASVATDYAAGKLGDTYASIEGALNSASADVKQALVDAKKAQEGGNLDLDGDGKIGISDVLKAVGDAKNATMDATTFTNFIDAYLKYISK